MNRFHSRLALALAAFLLALPGSVLRANEDPAIPATTPTSDFVLDAVNGTAYHKKTGLTWKRCAEGQTWNSGTATCDGSAGKYTWSQALSLGSGGWRLPNQKELHSIIERRNWAPAVNATVFPATPPSTYFWSASPYAPWAGYAWAVSFLHGNGNRSVPGDPWAVRLVRGGQSFWLAVTKAGTGIGTVTGPGIDCGADCSATYPPGTPVTLTAAASSGSLFSGWGGACSGSGTCLVTMDASKSVSATFTASGIPTHTLTVTRTGTGSITSTPAGIDCGATCSASFNAGAAVTLTSSAGAGYTFSGWGGACSGTGACAVKMNGDQAVTAQFVTAGDAKHLLKVGKANSGLVTSEPGGIACGGRQTACTALFSSVTLTAYPNPGYFVKNWVGCPGSSGATCAHTLSRPTTIKAIFAKLPKFKLKVGKTKGGLITSDPPGLKCGFNTRSCSASFVSGTEVKLNATPKPGAVFRGWAGACSGTGACRVTMDGSKGVGATFQ